MRFLATIPLALLIATPTFAAAPITGSWLTVEKDSVVTIAPCGALVCGKISRILAPTPDGPPVDRNNPNPALRKRPVLGMAILTGFKDDGKSWKGTIYDPRAGKTYKSYLTLLANGKLKVQGCIGPFCQSQLWTRSR